MQVEAENNLCVLEREASHSAGTNRLVAKLGGGASPAKKCQAIGKDWQAVNGLSADCNAVWQPDCILF